MFSFEEPHDLKVAIPVNPELIIYDDLQMVFSLSRSPTTRGHTSVVLRQPYVDLFSLKVDEFTGIMLKISTRAGMIGKFYCVARCALVTEGGNSLSIIPLHGLSKDWEPITCDLKEFHETFPGYISSKDGPQMDAGRLDDICSTIQKVSGLSQPFQNFFDGDPSDNNLFARIVRGELSQWRVWEDDQHIAFLTPFANTPGFTVLVPRAHLGSDIFALDEEAYSKLMAAAHTVGRVLKEALGISRCGMIFEGFEIDYAHVKLIPIYDESIVERKSAAGSQVTELKYEEKYQGFVTSLEGPLITDVETLDKMVLNAIGVHSFNLFPDSRD